MPIEFKETLGSKPVFIGEDEEDKTGPEKDETDPEKDVPIPNQDE